MTVKKKIIPAYLNKFQSEKIVGALSVQSSTKYFDKFSTYLIGKESWSATISFREDLFSALSYCYCCISKDNILLGALYRPTLQKVFKKLSEEDSWEFNRNYNPYARQDYDLSLLHAYSFGLESFNDDFHMPFERYCTDSRGPILSKEGKDHLLTLNKDHLFQYLRNVQFEDISELEHSLEIIYQLELSDKNIIFELMKPMWALKHPNWHYREGMGLLRDEELKEKTIKFLSDILDTNKTAVENFLNDLLLGTNNPKERTHRIEAIKPICIEYLKAEREEQKKRISKIFEVSEIDKTKSRLEIFMEISFFARSLQDFQATYKDYKDLIESLYEFRDRFFGNTHITNKFLDTYRKKDTDKIGYYEDEIMSVFINRNSFKNLFEDECFDLSSFEEILLTIRNFFGYESRNAVSKNLEKIIENYERTWQ